MTETKTTTNDAKKGESNRDGQRSPEVSRPCPDCERGIIRGRILDQMIDEILESWKE